MTRLATFALIVLVAAAASAAHAGGNVHTSAVESLDWTAADSDLIVRARQVMVVIRVDPVTRRDEWEEATLRVYETIKGRPVEGDIKVLRSTRHFETVTWP